MMDYPRRLARLRAAVAATEVSAVLVSGAANVRYLSGFTGSQGALAVDADRALLISDFRYRLQAAEQAPLFELVEVERWHEGLAHALRGLGCRVVGFEPAHLTYQAHQRLVAALGNISLAPVEGLVERLRALKGPQEIALMERAAAVSDGAMARVISLVRPGVSERELALAAESYIKREADAEIAFPPIIAAGPRSAQCHAEPGTRELAAGDLVVIDLGARWQGYGADLTRTAVVEAADAQRRDIYAACREAQTAARAGVRAGADCAALDAIARGIIAGAGYGEYFGHGLGHGVGIEAHEAPRLSPTADGSLAAGMTVTIEPGIYLPGVGGVRLEDLVVVTEEGHRALTHAPLAPELPALG
ncbi:MAG TPA: Xaa-Pro peptidase family protein [Armatimonadota bacterium]|nr:Xaa-Pro peptidase family protein [Armatimonadota bacterium]